ncbi:PREDICTED: uncharacterized protein LOC106818790 [Priapulus caudatus]|uniref:Uncharacterized protein LOC106818790 n=1 Tax=Priapulus caudatus TaxID=37621 RepID=A0ABM1F3D1_PRICU|nr:PREDICTED: uncharacterized protein LOC106818790 [Priapulus caudatus]
MAVARAVTWSAVKEDLLVVLWEERPCLYQPTSADYADRSKKVAALQEIAGELGIPVLQVQKRLTSLRTQYTKARRLTASNPKKAPTRKMIWLLEMLHFLEDCIGSSRQTVFTRSTSNLQCIDSTGMSDKNESSGENSEIEESSLNDSVNEQSRLNTARKSTKRPLKEEKVKAVKKKKDEIERNMLKHVAKCLSSENMKKIAQEDTSKDVCSAFGMYVSQALRKLSERTRVLAMNNIQNVIFEAQMSEYSTPQEGTNNYLVHQRSSSEPVDLPTLDQQAGV